MKTLIKKEDAVSPVIGTILMIAITVVLAASLLLYVYMTPSATYTPHIIGKFASVVRINDTSYKLIFSHFNQDVKTTQLKGVIEINGTQYTFSFLSPYDEAKAKINPLDKNTKNLKIIYRDLSNNSMINLGDYLLLQNLKTHTTYTIYFLDDTGEQLMSATIHT